MTFIEKIKFLKEKIREALIVYNIHKNPIFENNRLLGEILRNTHSIEKGLSLDNVRLGFGYKKIRDACLMVKMYYTNGGDMNLVQLKMFRDALSQYVRFHKEKGFENEIIQEVKALLDDINLIIPSSNKETGGFTFFRKPYYSESEYATFERLFKDRHSIREFDHKPVDSQILKRAIELAMRCPSACNRQCYRLYVIDHKLFSMLGDWVEGTGGFDKELDKLLIITGQLSVYRLSEQFQHVVSSSIFVAYLSMSLQANGIGACVIQRNIFPNKKWEKIKQNFNISGDELPVCCIGIGNLKEETKVPISNRLAYDEIVTVFE